jgi:hypothetical protein
MNSTADVWRVNVNHLHAAKVQIYGRYCPTASKRIQKSDISIANKAIWKILDFALIIIAVSRRISQGMRNLN